MLLAAATILVGCGGRTATAAPPAAVSNGESDDVALGLIEHHRYHHHGGVMLLIALSLDTLGVSPEQQAALQKIQGDLHARMEPARMAEFGFINVLADGLDTARIDTAKVDAAVAQLTAASATVHVASSHALNELHRLLTPPQRAALVDKVESQWAVWQKANADETGPAYPDGGHLSMLAATLDLTPDQVHTIRAGLENERKSVPRLDGAIVGAQLQAFGQAFRSESFDAESLTSANAANTHMVGWGAAHLAYFVETVSPVLTAAQRAKLALRMREHATHDPSAQPPVQGNP
jgi:Spy/CpxP family protein refolding chaperone